MFNKLNNFNLKNYIIVTNIYFLLFTFFCLWTASVREQLAIRGRDY